MIAILYQLFLLDPKAEKKDMLLAVDPPFSALPAIDAILSTLKFEGKSHIIVVGLEDKIDAFLKKVERLDEVEWMDFDLEKRKEALKELAAEFELQTMENHTDDQDREQVFGDEEEVTAGKKKKYPVDIPEANWAIWDAIETHPDFRIALGIIKARQKEVKGAKDDDYPLGLTEPQKRHWDKVMQTPEWKENEGHLKRAGKLNNKEIRMALKRNFYEEICAKLNKPSYNRVTKTQILDDRLKIKGLIIQGEEVGFEKVKKLTEHLMHADLIKKSGTQKFGGVSESPESNHCMLAHKIEWTLDPVKHSWLQLVSFLKREFKSEAFRETRDKLTTVLPQKGAVVTILDLVKEANNKIGVYVSHKLSQEQAAILTQETDKPRVEKKLCEYAKSWYKTGRFPKIDENDTAYLPHSQSGKV